MRNIDKIQRMAPEELATFLDEYGYGDKIEPFVKEFCDKCKAENAGECPTGNGRCDKNTTLAWLLAEE